jgi:hypothetical protein
MKYIELVIIIFFLTFFSTCSEFQSMTGYIFDYDTGKPVKGALVKFYSDCIIASCKKSFKTDITDDKGRYKIDLKDKKAIDGNKFYIEVKKDGYITLYDSFSIAKDNMMSIYLKEASSKEL